MVRLKQALKESAVGSSHSLRQGMIALLGFCFFLLVVSGVASIARDQIGKRDRYRMSFLDIDCAAPQAQERTEFLAEVQYLASLPDEVQLMDDGLGERLANAFALHPAVKKVEEIKWVGPRRLKVRLIFHSTDPVLPLAPHSTIAANTE
jgi:hypothetical protein